MTDQNSSEDTEVQMPPPSDEEVAPRREKKKFQVTQGKVFVGARGVMFLFSGYTLFSGGGDEPPIPGGATREAPGGAEVDVEVEESGRRAHSADGERAGG